MFNLQVTSTTMELLPLVCLCLLTRSGTTFADEGSKVIEVKEGSDVTLPCSLSTKENIEFKLFDWMKDGQKEVFLYVAGDHYNNGREGQDEQFKGRVSHFQDKLKHGDASIKIRNTKVTDSGDYTCDFLHRQPRQIFHIQLVVVEPNVIRVKEGSDVTLPCSLSSMEDIEYNFFIWRKDGQKEVFMYEGGFYYNNGREGQDEQFKGRVSHFPDELKLGNTSIIIRNTKLNDSGNYICAFPLLQPRQIFHIQLVVGPKVIRVEEDSNVTLPCSLSTKENIELNLFEWTKDGQKVFLYDAGDHYNNGRDGQDEQFKGRVSHFPDKLKHGDASIIIRNTSVNDSGDYTCAFPRLQPRQIFHIWLVVGGLMNRLGENIPGAVPKPYVSILYETKDGTLLCEVQEASPKPKVEWQDSAGNILPAGEPQASERGGRYDIILKTTVTKTDIYRCVATQEDISHQIYTETYMYIPGFPTGLIVGTAFCALLVGVVVFLSWFYSRRRSTQNSQRDSPQQPTTSNDTLPTDQADQLTSNDQCSTM